MPTDNQPNLPFRLDNQLQPSSSTIESSPKSFVVAPEPHEAHPSILSDRINIPRAEYNGAKELPVVAPPAEAADNSVLPELIPAQTSTEALVPPTQPSPELFLAGLGQEQIAETVQPEEQTLPPTPSTQLGAQVEVEANPPHQHFDNNSSSVAEEGGESSDSALFAAHLVEDRLKQQAIAHSEI